MCSLKPWLNKGYKSLITLMHPKNYVESSIKSKQSLCKARASAILWIDLRTDERRKERKVAEKIESFLKELIS